MFHIYTKPICLVNIIPCAIKRQLKLPSVLFDDGNIREGGGIFGKMQKAKEEEYFYKKTKNEIEKLHDTKEGQIQIVKEHIRRHKDAIKDYEKMMKEIENKSD